MTEGCWSTFKRIYNLTSLLQFQRKLCKLIRKDLFIASKCSVSPNAPTLCTLPGLYDEVLCCQPRCPVWPGKEESAHTGYTARSKSTSQPINTELFVRESLIHLFLPVSLQEPCNEFNVSLPRQRKVKQDWQSSSMGPASCYFPEKNKKWGIFFLLTSSGC